MERRLQADVAIVGAALPGLVAGAILTRHGRRVVIVDHADTVGGRGGGTRTPDGWWIDFGHRDGHDVGDCQFPWHHGVVAAQEADVTVALRAVGHPLRLHWMHDGVVRAGGAWTAAAFARLATDYFECPPDGLPEMLAVLARLAAATPDEVRAALPRTLGEWTDGTVRDPGVRRALLQMATVIFHPRPAEASVGRLMEFFQAAKGTGPYLAADEEVGGMQGLMVPWERAIRARGGTFHLGWKPVEIVADGGRVCGVVAVDCSNLVLEIEAPVVISTYPAWELFELLDARRFPPAFVAAADALRAHRADLVGWQAGLQRLPTLRATGEPDRHDGWNRLLAGAAHEYAGGYQITSMGSPAAAPPGRHLLSLVRARFFDGGTTAGEPWTVARRSIDDAVDYLRSFYSDLDACLAWSAYHYVAAPQSMSWLWAGAPRHELTVEGLRGLLLACSTLDAPAGIVDIGAYAGRVAAHAALAALQESA